MPTHPMSSFSLVRSPSLLLADDSGLPPGTFLCHNLSIFLCHQPLVYYIYTQMHIVMWIHTRLFSRRKGTYISFIWITGTAPIHRTGPGETWDARRWALWPSLASECMYQVLKGWRWWTSQRKWNRFLQKRLKLVFMFTHPHIVVKCHAWTWLH